MSTNEIISRVRESSLKHFVDPEFPPCDASLYDVTEKNPYSFDIVWRRPHEIWAGKTIKVFDSIDPNDVSQGHLGDCWWCAAISGVAENPKLIERLFITKEYNPEGVYKIRLCKNGEWIVVTVDDYLPCYPDGGPCFLKAQGPELWVSLIEKASAKVYGNYRALSGGSLHEGLRDLTGAPTENLDFYHDEELKDADSMFERLQEADERGFIMSCSTHPGSDKTQSQGLALGHAYSLIRVAEYGGHRLLNIRNPWGKTSSGQASGEWDGDWSDGSELWEDNEEMIEELGIDFDKHDGSFWISIDDFLEVFTEVAICKVEPLFECRLKGKFMKVVEKKDNDRDWVISKFFYKMTVPEGDEDTVPVTIGIH